MGTGTEFKGGFHMAFGILGFLIGILMLLFGGFMVFFFPSYSDSGRATAHQPIEFSVSGIVIGLVSLLIGFMLMFF